MKTNASPAGWPIPAIAESPLPANKFDDDGEPDRTVIYLRQTILNSRLAVQRNSLRRRQMLRQAIGRLVEDAFSDMAETLTDRLYELTIAPDDDDDDTGSLDDDDLKSLEGEQFH